MNIYLDIDGVLLANSNHASEGADEFLQCILERFHNHVYWLTTHCWKGENRCIEVLSPHLQPKTVELLKLIQPTEWNELKTDAIDFSQKFLWFDDDLYPEEEKVLEENNALRYFYRVDLAQNPRQLLDFIKNID